MLWINLVLLLIPAINSQYVMPFSGAASGCGCCSPQCFPRQPICLHRYRRPPPPRPICPPQPPPCPIPQPCPLQFCPPPPICPPPPPPPPPCPPVECPPPCPPIQAPCYSIGLAGNLPMGGSYPTYPPGEPEVGGFLSGRVASPPSPEKVSYLSSELRPAVSNVEEETRGYETQSRTRVRAPTPDGGPKYEARPDEFTPDGIPLPDSVRVVGSGSTLNTGESSYQVNVLPSSSISDSSSGKVAAPQIGSRPYDSQTRNTTSLPSTGYDFGGRPFAGGPYAPPGYIGQSFSNWGGGAIQPSFYPPQNDCCCRCSSQCRFRRNRHAVFGAHTVDADAKCNSALLKRIIERNVNSDSDESKQRVQRAAEDQFGGQFNVICGSGEFSYIAHTQKFCQHTVKNITCYIFRPL